MNTIPPNAKIIFDRRIEDRVDQMERTILVEVDGRKYLFELRNLSSTGATGRSDAPLAVGHALTMIFEGWRRVAGKVSWNRQGLLGVEFVDREEPISSEDCEGD